MKTLSVLLLVLFSCGCAAKYDLVVAAHIIPAGTVIQDADLTTQSVKVFFPINQRLHGVVTEDRSQVIGRTAKKGYVSGQYIYLTKIDP